VEWAEAVGGNGNDYCRDIHQAADGGYILAGSTRSSGFGDRDVLVVKLNSTGGVEWAEAVGGSGCEEGLKVEPSPEGDYFVIGYVADVFGAGYDDVLVVKLNSTGGVEWVETIGGQGDDEAFDAHQTRDGGYVMAGRTTSFNSGVWRGDVLIVKTAPNLGLKNCPFIKRIPLSSGKNLPPKLRTLTQLYAKRITLRVRYIRLKAELPRFVVKHVMPSVAKINLTSERVYMERR